VLPIYLQVVTSGIIANVQPLFWHQRTMKGI